MCSALPLLGCLLLLALAHAASSPDSSRFPLPPFLKKVSTDARREYIALLKDDSLSRRQFNEKQAQWREKQSSEVQSDVDKFNDLVIAHVDQVRNNATRTINELPAVMQKLHAIITDDDSSRSDEFKKVVELLRTTDRQTSELAIAFLRVYTGHRRCPKTECSLSKYSNLEIETALRGYSMQYTGHGEA